MASGNVLFKLLGQVFVDTDKADESMSKTTEKAESMADKIGKGAKTVGKIATTTVATATAMTGALVENAKNTSSVADEIDKASIRMGISTEKYQELSYVAEQTGVEMAVLEKAAKKLEGTDINMDDALESIMSLGKAEERAAKASELFGSAVAYNMAPMLEDGEKSFDALTQRAHDLGLVMSEDAVKSGVEFGDLMSDMEQSVQMLGASLGSAMMPVLNDVIRTLVDNMPQIQQLISDLAPVFSDLISQVMPPLIELLEAILPPLIKLIEAIVPIVSKVASVVVSVVGGIIDVVGQAITKIEDFLGGVIDFINGVVEAIKRPINAVIGGINTLFSALSFDIPEWIPLIGGNSISLPKIPMLANGGTITGSGSVIVGEKGPEILNLNSGASVVPLSGNATGTSEVVRAIQDMSNNIINAIRTNTNTVKVDDPYRIFKLVKEEEKKYNTILGKA